MFDLFESVVRSAVSVADIALAPVKVVAKVAESVVEPIADGVNEVVEDIKESI